MISAVNPLKLFADLRGVEHLLYSDQIIFFYVKNILSCSEPNHSSPSVP